MKLVPTSLTRMSHRTLLKVNASSPTILVVAGVVGLGATAVMAAKATRKIDPVLDEHKQARAEIGYSIETREQQKDLAKLYLYTGYQLTKIYGPTIFVGTTSAIAVLGGHKILRTRHAAALSAYSGLMEQFAAYRKRIVKTLGTEMEKDIFDGAHGEYEEDPNHPGEFKMKSKWDGSNDPKNFMRPWFDETNVNWSKNPETTKMFLTGVQNHANNMLEIRGHVFLSDVFDWLNMPREHGAIVTGWLRDGGPDKAGDGFIDFGFLTSNDPHTVAFRNGVERTVRLNFNVDGPIWNKF